MGDALGMPFEGVAPAAIPDRLTMLDARLGRGTYTDDTEMAIALAESLLEFAHLSRHVPPRIRAIQHPLPERPRHARLSWGERGSTVAAAGCGS